MKRIQTIIAIGVTLITVQLMQDKASAQVVTPSITDNNWVTGASVTHGLNTALIDYGVTDQSQRYGQLGACAYGGGGVSWLLILAPVIP